MGASTSSSRVMVPRYGRNWITHYCRSYFHRPGWAFGGIASEIQSRSHCVSRRILVMAGLSPGSDRHAFSWCVHHAALPREVERLAFLDQRVSTFDDSDRVVGNRPGIRSPSARPRRLECFPLGRQGDDAITTTMASSFRGTTLRESTEEVTSRLNRSMPFGTMPRGPRSRLP
jgi:hypothetical protein